MGNCESSNFIRLRQKVTSYGMGALKSLVRDQTSDVVLIKLSGEEIIIYRTNEDFYAISKSEDIVIKCKVWYSIKSIPYYSCMLQMNNNRGYLRFDKDKFFLNGHLRTYDETSRLI